MKLGLVIKEGKILYHGDTVEIKENLSKRGESSLISLVYQGCDYIEVATPHDEDDKIKFMEFIERKNLRGLIKFYLPHLRFLIK